MAELFPCPDHSRMLRRPYSNGDGAEALRDGEVIFRHACALGCEGIAGAIPAHCPPPSATRATTVRHPMALFASG